MKPRAKRRAEVSPLRVLHLLSILLVLGVSSLSAQKTDIVVLKNGDRITGEVKELVRGRLRLSTHAMGTVYIDWTEIAQVEAAKNFQVETSDGSFFFGELKPSADDREVVSVVFEAGQDDLLREDVVRMSRIRDTFLKRLDGSVSLGFDFTQATNLANLSFDSRVDHRTRKRENRLIYSSFFTKQREREDSTSRQELSFDTRRLREGRWFVFTNGTAQSNEELGLDLRVQGRAGAGRKFIQTNRTMLLLSAGLALSEEFFSGVEQDGNQLTAEGVIDFEFETFVFQEPEVDITTGLQIFPSLTESDRIRTELSVRVKRELLKDFFVNLTVLNSYDSRPPSEAEKNDLKATMSLGYTF